MVDKDGSDLHKRVLGSLPSADFSCHDPESDVSLNLLCLLIIVNGVSLVVVVVAVRHVDI